MSCVVEASLLQQHASEQVWADNKTQLTFVATSSKTLTRPKEEVEERLRDPPPPANFPPICPKNQKLRRVIFNIDKNVFQRNGLHNIPYRDFSSNHLPPQVFDGENWPAADVKTELPSITLGDEDVIDVWTQKSEEKEAEKANRVVYHDIPHNALKKLLAAIRHPVEMRLLPHVVREWHRQTFPISMVDCHKIARLATKYNEVDVVMQMVQPEVYGLYYDIKGIREIARGMAKRAAQVGHSEGQSEFTPEDILKRIPELVKCSVAADAKKIITDPPVLGTQLWGFVARFNNDEGFRTLRSVMEMYSLAERTIENLAASDSGPSMSSADTLPAEDRRQLAFDLKYQLCDYIPLFDSLRHFIDIVCAPYRACLLALEGPNAIQEEDAQQLSTDLRRFLQSRLSISIVREDKPSEVHGREQANQLKWIKLNERLGELINSRKLRLRARPDWELSLLKQNIALAGDRGDVASPTSEVIDFYLPLRAQAAVLRLERRLGEWKRFLKQEHIPATSQFKIKLRKYGENVSDIDSDV